MFILGILGWWYGPGWKKTGAILVQKLITTEDYFSIDLLLKTLFSPFRQISADSLRGGTMGDRLRAMFDKLFSRIIGAAVRLILILTASIWLLTNIIGDLIILLIWPLLPFLPALGIIFSLSGWMPWKQ